MSVEYLKKRIVDLRANIEKERERKSKDNEYYARMIAHASSASSKTMYKKSKIDHAASHDRNIERLKNEIERCKNQIAREKK